MRNRLVLVAAFVAAISTPAAAFAQQMPVAPDGTSMNEAPAAGVVAAVDACGNTPQMALGQTTPMGTPGEINGMFPKDITNLQPIGDFSSVTGLVVHTEGDLVLLRVPMEPALGVVSPTSQTPDKNWAVVRLPSGCQQMPADGAQVTAFGVPSMDGILNAEVVEASE